MDQWVAQEHRVANCILYAVRLKPWLAVYIIDRTVGSEEWIESAQLVHLYIHILRRNTLVSWNVWTTKEHARKTSWKQRVNWTLHLWIISCVVSSPICAILLTASEKTASQNKWSSGHFVTLENSAIGCAMHHGTINVSHVSMLDDSAVFFAMLGLKRQCLLLCTKDRWFIHIVPVWIDLGCSFKRIVVVKALPERLSILI